jgi:hypothetical protein
VLGRIAFGATPGAVPQIRETLLQMIDRARRRLMTRRR